MPTLIDCLAGSVIVAHGKGTLRLAPGEALVVAPGVWHEHHELAGASVRFLDGLERRLEAFGFARFDAAVEGGDPIVSQRLLRQLIGLESGSAHAAP